MSNKNRPLTIILVMFVVFAFVFQRLLLGSSSAVIKLGQAPALTGSISQSINVSGQGSNLLVAGKDYNFRNTKYFDGNTWAVTLIYPIKSGAFDPGMVVLEKVDGIYKVVLGPGSFFPSSILLSLPADVGQYLSSQGEINGTIGG